MFGKWLKSISCYHYKQIDVTSINKLFCITVSGASQPTVRKRLRMTDITTKDNPVQDMACPAPGPETQLLSDETPVKENTPKLLLTYETPLKENTSKIEPETPFQTVIQDISAARFTATPMQTPVTTSEREKLYTELNNVRRERDEALQKIELLEKLVNASSLTSVAVEGNNEQCKMLTGLSWDVFLKLFLFLSSVMGNTASGQSLPLREQLFLTLLKLRHNLSFEFLAQLKGIPKTTLIDYFLEMD